MIEWIMLWQGMKLLVQKFTTYAHTDLCWTSGEMSHRIGWETSFMHGSETPGSEMTCTVWKTASFLSSFITGFFFSPRSYVINVLNIDCSLLPVYHHIHHVNSMYIYPFHSFIAQFPMSMTLVWNLKFGSYLSFNTYLGQISLAYYTIK